MAAQVLSAKEVAEKLGTDGRTLRKFLRKDAEANGTETPGKGGRYQIKAGQVKSLQKRFQIWSDARTATVTEDGDHEDDSE